MTSKKSVSNGSSDSVGTPTIHTTGIGGAVSIDIRGARGPNAVTINGVYDPTDEVCNDWPVYQKRGDSNKWLEFFNQSNKWYIKATNDRGKARGWMRLNSSNAQTGVMVNRPELCKEVSEVWDGSKWTSQPSVTIVTARQRLQDDIRSGTLRRLRAVPVCISGATGPSGPSINGIYEPTDEICGGWPVYHKKEPSQSSSGLSSSTTDSEKWLEYIVATNEWYVKPTTDKGKAEGWMCIGNSAISSSVFGEEIKRLEDKFRATLMRTLPLVQSNINTPGVEKRVEDGLQQLLAVNSDIESKIAKLHDRQQSSSNQSSGLSPASAPHPVQSKGKGKGNKKDNEDILRANGKNVFHYCCYNRSNQPGSHSAPNLNSSPPTINSVAATGFNTNSKAAELTLCPRFAYVMTDVDHLCGADYISSFRQVCLSILTQCGQRIEADFFKVNFNDLKSVDETSAPPLMTSTQCKKLRSYGGATAALVYIDPPLRQSSLILRRSFKGVKPTALPSLVAIPEVQSISSKSRTSSPSVAKPTPTTMIMQFFDQTSHMCSNHPQSFNLASPLPTPPRFSCRPIYLQKLQRLATPLLATLTQSPPFPLGTQSFHQHYFPFPKHYISSAFVVLSFEDVKASTS
eukprot:gene33733-43594_t